jgi:hypothetical protein
LLEIFGIHLKLIPSTSPVPGKLGASIMEADGSVRADMFMLDPVGDFLQFDEGRLQQLLYQARMTQGGAIARTLSYTDGMVGLLDAFRRMFGGRYSGPLGFGEFGGLMATVQSLMAITATVIAFVLKLPFQAVGWFLRRKLQQEIANERQHVLSQVSQFFHSISN